ncbi:pilus assembly protein [Desulfosediminicola flagellatus]|uniref:pilus assembly protein n=1 Tax=Desulfosediminicola flagellatus TaxID=2569541 RepID=UPI0010AB8EFE|nr:hypothetical protein [Desulfosediminicola flagellatus]
MKFLKQSAFIVSRLFLFATLTFIPLGAKANVCQDGLGLPPFLSAGADPNLLLVLDNSGSMLDLAYVDESNIGECVDKGYSASKQYAGLFDPDRWYKWVDSDRQWLSGTKYEIGDIVYSNGVFYRAESVTSTFSTGADIESDTSVIWEEVHYIRTWTNGESYPENSFVRYEDQLYYSSSGGIANDSDTTDGVTIQGDTLKWVAVESTWLNAFAYVAGDIVSDKGMLYIAATAGISSGTGVADDAEVTWVRLSEGYFQQEEYQTVTDAASALSGFAGSPYRNDDIYLHIQSVDGTPASVPAFAAKGNLLNWAAASKFDIQKEILTGGKYDDNQDLLISEGRGCSSRGFVKEIQVTGGTGTSVITFSIRGFNEDDWVDSTDNTTRIEILGVSSGGFIGSTRQEACQTAIDEVAKGAAAIQGTIKNSVKTCLAYDGANNVLADSNAAYNHSIHTCWSIVKKGYTTPAQLGNVSEIYNACEKIYENGIEPATIDPQDSGYMCYGVYNQSIPDADSPTGGGSSRLGYIGRCWETGEFSEEAECLPVTCTSSDNDLTADPAVKCFEDKLLYECSGNYNTNSNNCNKPWVKKLTGSGVGSDGLCDDSTIITNGKWTDDVNPSDADQCVREAMWDYCGSLQIPEVIDPSDQIFNTGETWGMVGSMIDSGIVAEFGTDRPLIVMKGYISQSSTPEGLLHEVAGDIRLGAMAFNANGAYTECQEQVVNDTIVKYCPDFNRDGAKVIAPINAGDAVVGTTTHITALTGAINDIRATAWTPLAEALYNALGYYGQNTSMRLDSGDFQTALENSDWADPVQYSCQENYILAITEGASTADIHPDVKALITSMGLEDGTVAAADEGECKNTNGKSDLFGSTYLDDLTFYGQNASVSNLFTTPSENPGQMVSDDGTFNDKQNITTYMVVAGNPRDNKTLSECNPATLMKNAAENGGTTLLTGEDPAALESNLRTALSDILFRASAGSAASVISSSRSGEGGVYQAIFWPKVDRGIGKEPLTWIGDVHAFFIDERGYLWDDYSGNANDTFGELWTEDTNGNGILDEGEDVYPVDADGNAVPNGKLDGDRRVITYYNETSNSTQVCLNQSVIDIGVCNQSDYFNTTETSIDLKDFDAYLWSVKERLAEIGDSDILENRTITNGKWNFSGGYPKRYIFTWNDLNNDGIVDADFDGDGSVDGDSSVNEVLEFLAGQYASELDTYTSNNNRSSILQDFNVETAGELDKLIKWVRGYDEFEPAEDGSFTPNDLTEDINDNGIRDTILRCRQYPDCDYTTLNRETWRLGDVIHSTPTLVSRPSEGYHYIYKDLDYARFYKKYLNRRHVIYFGGNDGMLHAVNGGFYQAGVSKFMPCRDDQRDSSTGECAVSRPYEGTSEQAYPQLGDELWAYVPYNLQPHLKCLADPSYEHKYFVDAPPRIFDVRIFPDDEIHPGGWGTILVGYMGFGGAPHEAEDPGGVGENRKFVSSYFVLDVTDPERAPKLIAEMTTTTQLEDYDGDGVSEDKYARMGYTTSMPSVVVMRNDLGFSEWFLVLGNGPTTIEGENDQQGKIGIVPLNSLTGVNWKVNQDGSYDPTSRTPFRIPNEEPTTASTIANMGRKLIPGTRYGIESFIGDIVTVDFDIRNASATATGVAYKSDVVYFGTTDGTGFDLADGDWGGDGRLYRLLTQKLDVATGKQVYAYPEDWELKKMIDAKGPITAAPNVGFDNTDYWVYFGTGRFYAPEDKRDDSTQYFFGIKEPRDENCNLTWDTIDWLYKNLFLDELVKLYPDYNWDEFSWSSWNYPIDTTPAAAEGNRGLLRADRIRVVENGTSGLFSSAGDYVYCEDQSGDKCYLPFSPLNPDDGVSLRTYYSFSDLVQYVKGEACGSTDNNTIGVDGWYRELNDSRERSLGMPTLLGGLVTFTTYQPFADICQAEGLSSLYGVYFLTGTAWYEDVIGTYSNPEGKSIVKDKLDLGKGQAMTPSLQVGTGPNEVNAFIQTSTGEIVQVGQKNKPTGSFKSKKISWKNK